MYGLLKHRPIDSRTSESSGRPWMVGKGQVKPRKYLKRRITAHRLWHPRWSLSQTYFSGLFKNCHSWLLPRVVCVFHSYFRHGFYFTCPIFMSVRWPSSDCSWSGGDSSGTQSYTSATFRSFTKKNIWKTRFQTSVIFKTLIPGHNEFAINNPSFCLFYRCLAYKGQYHTPFSI